jgi:hypothetical protein
MGQRCWWKRYETAVMRILLFTIMYFLSACSPTDRDKQNIPSGSSSNKIKEELLTLERKWLGAEFVLDTAYISTLMDPSFIDISPDHIHDKQQALTGMHDNISAMRKDSIFLDSIKFEDPVVNVYDNTAVVTLITHSYKKDKGMPVEKRMRFYDVWIKRGEDWKAVSSQGTVVEQVNKK